MCSSLFRVCKFIFESFILLGLLVEIKVKSINFLIKPFECLFRLCVIINFCGKFLSEIIDGRGEVDVFTVGLINNLFILFCQLGQLSLLDLQLILGVIVVGDLYLTN
jgi:hypothetical protein